MRLLPLLVFISFVCYHQAFGISDEILSQAQDKLDELIEKSSAGSNGKKGLIEIAGSDFEVCCLQIIYLFIYQHIII